MQVNPQIPGGSHLIQTCGHSAGRSNESSGRDGVTWSHFAHGADIGLRGSGGSKAQAFEEIAMAPIAAVTDPDAVAAEESISLFCEAPSDEILLVDLSGDCLRPLPGSMENSKDYNTVFLHAIGNDVGNINQYSFAGSGYSSGSAHARLPGEFGDGTTDAICNPGSGRGIIHGDEAPNLKQVIDGVVLPSYLHSGASPSSSVPQLASQWSTASWLAYFAVPLSAFSTAVRTACACHSSWAR
jgi:hypothetical protein